MKINQKAAKKKLTTVNLSVGITSYSHAFSFSGTHGMISHFIASGEIKQ